MANEMKCTTCGETKQYAEMRKRHVGEVPTQCNACVLKVRKIREAKQKEEIKKLKVEIKPVKKVEVVVQKRTFQFTPYVPEKHWVRNNGNVHIPSRGYQC